MRSVVKWVLNVPAILGATVTWSSIKPDCVSDPTQSCCPETACVLPAGDTYILDDSMTVGTLDIEGDFKWDTTKDGLVLSSCWVLVKPGASFELGTEASPMLNNAEIFIRKPSEDWHPINSDTSGFGFHDDYGSRFFVAEENTSVVMHGKKLDRTWTLLSADAAKESSELLLRDDPATIGWKVGDELGIAMTNRDRGSNGIITAINGRTVTLDSPLASTHWGGMRNMQGYMLEMAAEVINLSRNIKIHGPDENFMNQTHADWHNGFHFGTFNADNHDDSVFDIRYIRTQNCGQFSVMGRYCFHFHLKKQCPRCKWIGNSVYNAIQGAMVIHGTHQSTLEENVMWNTASVGIYTEDGNEMNNTFTRNVMLCEDIAICRFSHHPWQPESGVKEGGLFWFGMTNNAIENRVAGHEHGHWTRNTGNGKGQAAGKVCTQSAPFGTYERNTYHDCGRFGVYPDNQHPRQLERDEDGYVVKVGTKMPSCNRFKPDGSDNGQVSYIDDQFDWHNIFSGQYDARDISYRRFTSVDVNSAIYWKRSKNMADPSAYHIEDSLYLSEDYLHHSLIPGMNHVFRIKNTTFSGQHQHGGGGALEAPQHCGLGKLQHGYCLVHILLEGVSFNSPRHVKFGASGGYPVAPSYITTDDSLMGYSQVTAPQMDGYSEFEGCTNAEPKFVGGYACDSSVKSRILMIWSPDMGELTLSGPGYNPNLPCNDNVGCINNGKVMFTNDGGTPGDLKIGTGYGAWVKDGETYHLHGMSWQGDIYVIYSDPLLATLTGSAPEEEFVDLVLHIGDQNVTCRASASDDRAFVAQNGVAHGVIGGDCTDKFWTLAQMTGVTTTTTTTTTTTPVVWHECPCGNTFFDARCENGGLGCHHCKSHCRICDADESVNDSIYIPCSDIPYWPDGPNGPTTTTTTTTTGTGTTTTTTTTTTTRAPPPPEYSCDDCGGSKYDFRCWEGDIDDPFGGLGCNLCGLPKCRACYNGEEGTKPESNPFVYCFQIPDPPGGTTTTVSTTTITVTTTTNGPTNPPSTTTTMTTTSTLVPPEYSCDDCGGTKYDARCWSGQDPFGGLGCNHCGKPHCRICYSGAPGTKPEGNPYIYCTEIPDVPTTTTTTPSTTTTSITTTSTTSIISDDGQQQAD